jgi:hypothetical protein
MRDFLNTNPTIYIVSGFMRSGTSAMMKCLERGGIEVIYDKGKDAQMEKFSDASYTMNPKFYELLPEDFNDLRFLLRCKNKAVKMLAPGLNRLPNGPIYRIIVMLRHPIEIHASYLAAYEQNLNETIAANGVPAAYPPSPAMYYYTASRVISEQKRKGRFVTTVGMRSMIKYPLRTFTNIAEKHGWPIEPFLSASAVEPDRLRIKLEDLLVRDYEWEKQKNLSPYEDFGPTWPRMPEPPKQLVRLV